MDIEVDFFNEYRIYFEEQNICICISSTQTLTICRNKKAQQEFINQNVPEVRTIPTLKVERDMDAPFDYPIVCKPYDGRSSQGLRYVYTEEDWEAVKTCFDNDKYIVQPFIKGRIVTVDVVRQKDGQKLAEAFDIIVCVNFEFLRDEDGEYHYVEYNPRFSRGIEFSCIAGYDCVGNHIRSFENKPIDDFSLTREMYIARKFEEYVTRVN